MANVLYLNSSYVKTPQKLAVKIFDKAAVSDNAAGEALVDRVATKRQLDIEWGALSNAEISAILALVTDVFFTVKYPDPETGAEKTITCRVTDKSAPIYRDSGTPVWEGLKLKLVEK